MTTAAPSFDERGAAAILEQHYGMSGSLKSLTSERDRNFLLDTGDGSEFVLKIANSAEHPSVTTFQSQALLHLADQALSFPVPRIVPTIEAQPAVEVVGQDSRRHTARLVTWLEGEPLQYAERKTGYAATLGRCLAELGQALKPFEHTASDYALLWDLKGATSLRTLLECVGDVELRALCRARLDRFDSSVRPALQQLRWQLIHNDLNPSNVLVDPERPDVVVGVIDFGDMVRSPLIVDVAVAAAYLLQDSAAPLADVIQFVGAYNATEALHREEVDLLFDLLLTRSTMTILITHWRASRYPENRDYILRNESTARKMLNRMSNTQHADVTAQFWAACSS